MKQYNLTNEDLMDITEQMQDEPEHDQEETTNKNFDKQINDLADIAMRNKKKDHGLLSSHPNYNGAELLEKSDQDGTMSNISNKLSISNYSQDSGQSNKVVKIKKKDEF